MNKKKQKNFSNLGRACFSATVPGEQKFLPPENATGNFVKVVQRVPVKILLDGDNPDAHMIAPGMSVEAIVITHMPPRWLAPFVE